LTGDEVREIIEREVGELEALPVFDSSQPATDFRYVDGSGVVGFINPVSHPFCGACNRLRLTAEGQVRNCLFSTIEWDARAILRTGGSDQELADLVTACVGAKKFGHGIDTPNFVQPQRAMYQIGG
jgi:GTP 3',8-cyclase